MKNSEREFPGDFTPDEMEFAGLLRQRYGWQMDRCPSPDLLRAAAEDALPAEAARMVSAHVESCALCSALREDLATIQPVGPTPEQLRRVRAGIPRKEKRVAFAWLRPIPVLATIACAALGIWVLRSFISSGNSNSVRNEPKPPAREPEVVEIAIGKAPIQIPDNLLFAYRGAAGDKTPSRDEWTNALAAYAHDDYARAVADLATIERKYPKFADGFFYRGVSLLLLNKNSDALASLQNAVALANDQRLPEARWYLGAALARVGKPADAAQQWQAVCDAHAAYSDQACRDLPRLKLAR
jgi:hypothetical protein